MARIRSIHPGQANDVDFTECSMPARLLAILLRNFADDNGVFVWREKQIKMDCFPADNIDVGPLLDELIANKQVKRFTKSGIDYGIFRNFRRWQRPEKPKTVHPIDDELLEYGGQSPTNRQPVADESSKVSADGKELEPEPDKGNGRKVNNITSPPVRTPSHVFKIPEPPQPSEGEVRSRVLEAKLRKAAGWENHPSPNLSITGPIEAIIEAGADLDRDVLPVIAANAAKCESPNWNFFIAAIRRAMTARMSAGKPLDDKAEADRAAKKAAAKKILEEISAGSHAHGTG